MVSLRALEPAAVADIAASLGPPWSNAGRLQIEAAVAQARGALHGVMRLLEGEGLEFAAALRRMFDALPEVDWRTAHILADQVAAPRSEDYETLMAAVYDWLEEQIGQGHGGPARLAPFAQVWEKVSDAAQQTEALNLDKRPFVLALLADLAAAVRASR